MLFNYLCMAAPSASDTGVSASSPLPMLLIFLLSMFIVWIACRTVLSPVYTGLPFILRFFICIGGGIMLGIIIMLLIVGILSVASNMMS